MMRSLQTRRKREICKRQIMMEEGRERKGLSGRRLKVFYSLTYRETSDRGSECPVIVDGRVPLGQANLHTHDLRVSCK